MPEIIIVSLGIVWVGAAAQPDPAKAEALEGHFDGYRQELTRLKKELERTDSRLSSDTDAYKTLRHELKSAIRYLNMKDAEGNPVNMDYSSVAKVMYDVNTGCQNYMKAHSDIMDLSDRQQD